MFARLVKLLTTTADLSGLSFSSHADYSDVMLGLLLSALEDLKQLLKSQGSDLIIGLGSADDIIANIVNEVTTEGLF